MNFPKNERFGTSVCERLSDLLYKPKIIGQSDNSTISDNLQKPTVHCNLLNQSKTDYWFTVTRKSD